jgi:hypothetical protein
MHVFLLIYVHYVFIVAVWGDFDRGIESVIENHPYNLPCIISYQNII